MNYFLKEKSEIIGSKSVCIFVVLAVVMPCCFQKLSFPINTWEDEFDYNSRSIWCCSDKPLFFFVAILIDEKWLTIWLTEGWSLSLHVYLLKIPLRMWISCSAHSSVGILKFSERFVWTVCIIELSTLCLTHCYKYFS